MVYFAQHACSHTCTIHACNHTDKQFMYILIKEIFLPVVTFLIVNWGNHSFLKLTNPRLSCVTPTLLWFVYTGFPLWFK